MSTITKTDNELIAEFMGAAVCITNPEYIVIPFIGLRRPHQLDYHTSWDWLMPVVEKIEQFKFDDGELDDGDEPDTAFLRTFKGGMVRINRFSLFHCETKIEATHMAVVEFIKWHNEQKK